MSFCAGSRIRGRGGGNTLLLWRFAAVFLPSCMLIGHTANKEVLEGLHEWRQGQQNLCLYIASSRKAGVLYYIAAFRAVDKSQVF